RYPPTTESVMQIAQDSNQSCFGEVSSEHRKLQAPSGRPPVRAQLLLPRPLRERSTDLLRSPAPASSRRGSRRSSRRHVLLLALPGSENPVKIISRIDVTAGRATTTLTYWG